MAIKTGLRFTTRKKLRRAIAIIARDGRPSRISDWPFDRRPFPGRASRLLSLTEPFHHLARLTHKCAIKDPAAEEIRGPFLAYGRAYNVALPRIYIIGVTNLHRRSRGVTHRSTTGAPSPSCHLSRPLKRSDSFIVHIHTYIRAFTIREFVKQFLATAATNLLTKKYISSFIYKFISCVRIIVIEICDVSVF